MSITQGKQECGASCFNVWHVQEQGMSADLDSLTQAALADLAQAAELEAVGSYQQMLRHGHVQIRSLQLLADIRACQTRPRHLSHAHNI